MVGMYDKAMAEVERADQMVRNNQVGQLTKGRILLDLGKTDEAIKIFKEAKSKYNNYAQALIKAGRIDEVRSLIAELESMPMNSWWARCLSLLYCQLEEKDKCFEWLNYPEKHAWYPWIRVMWIPESIKQDPRFLKLLDDMNLPPPAPLEFDPNLLEV
jgi:tetratricopeptide (TPR) repeat protein